jgi:hypothetical protein
MRTLGVRAVGHVPVSGGIGSLALGRGQVPVDPVSAPIAVIVDKLAEIARVLSNADPDDKAEVSVS